MPKVTAHLSISLDGFIAGPHQTQEQPLGVRGMELHTWHLGPPDNDVDRAMTERILAPRGAYVMGRNMFGPVRGEWGDRDWRGWWGDEPPYHAPVFVLTHYPHDPIEMEGGTTFHFVDGFDEALERAIEAAEGDTVTIAGGASAVRQGLRGRASSTRSWSTTRRSRSAAASRRSTASPASDLAPVEVHASPHATHVVYRVNRA